MSYPPCDNLTRNAGVRPMHSEVYWTPAQRRSAVGAGRRNIILCIFVFDKPARTAYTNAIIPYARSVSLHDTSGPLHPNERAMTIEHFKIEPADDWCPANDATRMALPFLILILIFFAIRVIREIRGLSFPHSRLFASIRGSQALTNRSQTLYKPIHKVFHKPFTNLHKPFTNQYKALQAFTNHHNQILTHDHFCLSHGFLAPSVYEPES